MIDVFGWFSTSTYATAGARLELKDPLRILDTREAAYGAAPIVGGAQRAVQIRGVSNGFVPNDAQVDAVLVNVTGRQQPRREPEHARLVAPTSARERRAGHDQQPEPAPGQVRPNLAIVPLSSDGKIYVSVFAGQTDIVLDVLGYFITGNDPATRHGRVVPLVSPFRAFDTREAKYGSAPLGPASAEDWSFDAFSNDVKVGRRIGRQATRPDRQPHGRCARSATRRWRSGIAHHGVPHPDVGHHATEHLERQHRRG